MAFQQFTQVLKWISTTIPPTLEYCRPRLWYLSRFWYKLLAKAKTPALKGDFRASFSNYNIPTNIHFSKRELKKILAIGAVGAMPEWII